MQLSLSRDGVAAGDDVESHDQVIEVDERRPFELVLRQLSRDRYFPSDSAGTVTWIARAGRHGQALAVMARQWEVPHLLVDSATGIDDIGDAIHFEYVTGKGPDEVIEELRAQGSS